MSLDDLDIDVADVLDGDSNELKTSMPGVEVTTRLADADVETLESVHERQLLFALEHAEEAKEATRM